MTKSASKGTKKPLHIRGGRVVTYGVFLILIGGSIAIGFFSDLSKPELNVNVPMINSEVYRIWNGSSMVFWMSNVVNGTSNYDVRVAFWVNTSEYNFTSYVCFKYFNGSHGTYYNASDPIGDRLWNYRQWWTEYDFYPTGLFNRTVPNELDFVIPRQKGNTKIVYQLTVAEWNGTDLEFFDYNGTYVVRYSDYEVLYEQRVYVTTGFYWASHPILAGLIFVAWRVYKPEEEAKIEPEERKNEHHLDERLLIDRSNNLDGAISGLRIGASILLGIGTGATLWLGNVSPPLQGYFFLGLAFFVLCTFTAIILTFSSTTVEKEGFRLKRGLLPTGQNLAEYEDHLKDLVARKEDIISRVEAAIGVALIYSATFLIMGFIVGIFPATDILGDRIWSMIPVGIALGLAFFVGLSWSVVMLGQRVLGLYEDGG